MTARSPRAVCGLLLCAALGGCKATATVPHDDGGDLGVDDLGPSEDLTGADFTVLLDLACAATGPEICGNGCDDDRNGYVDDDDPACTTQLLVTTQAAQPALVRVILEPQPHTAVVDTNGVPAASFADYRRAFAPSVFLALETGTALRRIELSPDAGTYTDHLAGYNTRDLCIFNNELIVVERAAASKLHRLLPDGTTEIGSVPLGAVLATSCASDGKRLYVSVHDATGTSPSQFYVFDATYTQVETVAVPTPLATAGYVHALDIAWTRNHGVFYGLFTTDLTPKDSTLDGTVLVPFAFDGAVGNPIDAGVMHGIGEFVP